MAKKPRGPWRRKLKLPPVFRCGHPRTPANTESKGIDNGVRCKQCRSEYKKDYYIRNKVKAAARAKIAEKAAMRALVSTEDW